jgi:hypothetical protein
MLGYNSRRFRDGIRCRRIRHRLTRTLAGELVSIMNNSPSKPAEFGSES